MNNQVKASSKNSLNLQASSFLATTDISSPNFMLTKQDNPYLMNPRPESQDSHDQNIQTVLNALFESDDPVADQSLRRGNSQTLNRDNTNLSAGTFGSMDINIRDTAKSGGNKNGLMKMGSNEWSDSQNSKFGSVNQNLTMAKTPTFDGIESNLSWRSITDFQPTQERVFIERIEQYSQNIMANHNKICPFTGKYLELNKLTASKLCAFYLQSRKRFYLAEQEAYSRFANSIINPVQLVSIESLLRPTINYPAELALIEKDSFSKLLKRTYFIIIEGSHPISTLPLFRIEKSAYALEHSTQKNQILMLDLANRMPLLFDSNSYNVPFEEFKLTISIHQSHSNMDPVIFEFLVDLSKVPAGKLQTRTPVEILVNSNGNSILIGSEIIFAPNTKLQGQGQDFISLDFGRTAVLSLKHFIFSLPFKFKTGIDSPSIYIDPFQQTASTTNPFSSPPPFYSQSEQNEEFDIMHPKVMDSPHFQTQKRQADTFGQEQQQQQQAYVVSKSEMLPPGIIISPPTDSRFNESHRDLRVKINNNGMTSNEEGSFNNYKYEEDKDTTLDTSPISDYNNTEKKNNTLIYRAEDFLNRQDSKESVGSTGGGPNKNKYSGYSTPSHSSASTPYVYNPKGAENFQQQVQIEEAGNFSDEMIENFKLSDHIGNLVEYAKTYQGSRILQKFFPRANQNEIDDIIHEIQYKIDELMLDPYANYMFQSLAQSCSAEQRFFLLQKIAPSMARVACDRKGTHSLQGIVSLINRECEDKLIQEAISDKILDLSLDPQGTHLIQKLIVSISINNINFIYEQLILKFVEVANHSFGVCVLKQLMTKVEKSETHKKKIIELLYQNIENLIQNPFGNYIIQHALDVFPKECNNILDRIVDKVIQYSNQKFSSNVVEKCLVFASEESKKRYFAEILKGDRLLEMMKNKYGNYVINKSIAHADQEDKQAIILAISRCVNSINVSKYRTRWIAFLEEMNSSKFNPGQVTRSSIFRQGSGMSADSESSRKLSDGEAELNDDSPSQGKRDFDRNTLSKFYYQSGVGKGSNDSVGSLSSPTVVLNKYGGSSSLKPKGNHNHNNNNNHQNNTNSNSSGSPKKGKGNQNHKYYVEKSNKNSYYNS